MTQIWTRLHHLIELVGDEARVFADCPHYVIDEKLLDVLVRAAQTRRL